MKSLKFIKGLVIALTCLFPVLASAEVPSWYTQKGYDVSGIINQIDTRNRIILVGEDLIKIAAKVKVHSLDDEFYSLSRLKVGDLIGIDVTELEGGRIEIVEIWLLDKDGVKEFATDSAPLAPVSPANNGKGGSSMPQYNKQWRKY